MKSIFAGIIATIGALLAGDVVQADELVIPSMTYRTGPYASGGIPFSDGFADYITLLNERDGGIGGKRLQLAECEYGYNTDRGIACFEELVSEGGLVFNPLSTGVTYALIPRAHELGVPLHTMGYGLTAAADGATYPYAFNFPAHYWHAATTQIAHIKEIEGGSLEGVSIMHMHHNSGYGKEPIATLQELAEVEGFDLMLMPVDHPGEDQDATWDSVQEQNPDYILLWGWGVMNTVALEKAVETGFPMDRFFGVWWSISESDLKPLGADAEGYKAVTFHAVGTGFKIFNEMSLLVYQTGKARGEMNNIGEVLYNRGIMSAIFSTEAIRLAMEIHGTSDVTREMVRDGLEQLEMTEQNMINLGMEGFVPPLEVTCENHVGTGLVAVKQWDSRIRRWEIVTDYYEPNNALIQPQIEAASLAFAEQAEMEPTGCN